METAFQGLKKQFNQEPILKWFDPQLRIVIKIDTFNRALGACLN